MALSKEEIYNIISKEPHGEKILKSVSNYFEGLSTPVSVAIGMNKYGGRDAFPEQIEELTNLLRSAGIDAVSNFDKEALDTSKFVVDGSGVSFPFLSPEDALKATIIIEKTAIDAEYNLIGHANLQTSDSMLYSANRRIGDGGYFDSKKIDIKASHPNIEKFEETEAKVGGNFQEFIDRKVKEAYTQSDSVDIIKMSEENVYLNEGEYLYRGGALGNNPYVTISEFNARKVAHSSPALAICSGFSGKGNVASTKGGAEYKPAGDGIEYGFIYKYKSMGEEQVYYGNVGLETARDPKTIPSIKQNNNLETFAELNPVLDVWNSHNGDLYETPVLPHHNKLEAIYLHVGRYYENKLFEIPLNEEGKVVDGEWKDFLYLHEPSDDKVKGYLAYRRDAQKKEQAVHPENVHKLELKEGLKEKNYKDLSNVGTLSFLQSVAYRGEISVDKEGLIYCNDNIDIHKTGIEKIPNMSNVKIKGNFFIGDIKMSLLEMPEVEGYIFSGSRKFRDADKVPTGKILKIFNGKVDNEGFVELKNTLGFEFDKVPLDIKNYKFKKLDISIPFQKLSDLPETVDGCSNAKIKDQSDIPDMSAEKFIYKLYGNRGMSDVPPLYENSLNSRAPIRGKDLIFNLSSTNIQCLPKELAKYDVKEIIFNKDIEINNLETVPYTTNGVYDLNFNGDLSKETFESFISKTKGTDWVEKNTYKAPDGHLVINGEFDFLSSRYEGKQAPMTIKAFPKDFAEVEFKGDVNPFKISQLMDAHKYIDSKKNDEFLSVYTSKEYLNADFSEFKAKGITIEGNVEKMHKLNLPKETETLHINEAKFESARLPEIPASCKNVNINSSEIGYDLNLSKMDKPNISITKMDLSEKGIILPKECKRLSIANTVCDKLAMPEKIDAVSLENVSFKENMVLDLSSCRNVDIGNCDLSKIKLILPKTAERFNIKENVKFPPDFILDMSGIEHAGVNYDTMASCKQVKLPKKILKDNPKDVFRVTENVEEVKLSFIKNNFNKISVPDSVKIVEDEKVPYKTLEAKGITKNRIKALKQEHSVQRWNKFKNVLGLGNKDKDLPSDASSDKKSFKKEMKAIFRKTGRKGFSDSKVVKTTNLTKEKINNLMKNDKER